MTEGEYKALMQFKARSVIKAMSEYARSAFFASNTEAVGAYKIAEDCIRKEFGLPTRTEENEAYEARERARRKG